MKKNYGKQSFFSALLILLAVSTFLFSVTPLHAAPLKFAVISDSHIYEQNHGPVLKLVLLKIKTINASSALPIKYIVVNGDMVFNHKKFSPQTPESYKKWLDTFFSIVESNIKGMDIKLLIGRGNHDNHYTDDGDHVPYDVNYHSVLQKYKHLLAFYADGSKSPSYHFTDDDVSFVMLNMVSITTDDGRESTADITWLNGIKKDTKTHTFVFSHYPLFSGHKNPYSMANSGELLDSMAKNGFRYYIAGHDHIFTHSILEKKDGQGKVVASVNQLVCPNSAGGMFSRNFKGLQAQNPGGWEARLNNVDATFNDKKPGFLVVEVANNSVGVTVFKVNLDKAYKVILR